MRVLITGGAGFIGSHLAEALLGKGHAVSIIDDLSTGSIQNIEHLKLRYGAVNGSATTQRGGLSVVASSSAQFRYIVDTVMNVPLLAELVDQCDVIYHLAAAVGVKLIVESPVRTIETNVQGTEVVLQLANKKKKKVLVASTSEVYGKATKIPFSEEDDLVMGATVKGRWAYACSKALDEFLAIAYWKEKNLPVVVVRLFNTVGPRQTGQYGMVLPTFVRQALSGAPITVYGDGKQSRSFTYVGDVVDALVGLALCDRAVGQVFNVGNAREISIEDLAHRVKTLAGSKSPIEHIPYAAAYGEGFEDMPRRVPDTSKIRRHIGWEPRVQLNEAIEKVISFQRNSLAEEGVYAVTAPEILA
jgi:UDP-glucose 4-epimerase